MEKLDLFKQHKSDYVMPKSPKLINITEDNYLVISGQGAPGGKAFEDAISALYAVAYTVKMTRKKHGKGDYVICKLEARYWSSDNKCLSKVEKALWQWQLMIRTPSQVNIDDIKQAAKVLSEKGKTPSVHRVEMKKHHFGQCVQMLHVGSYDNEPITIADMLSFATQENVAPKNEHCEVYISDPRRIPAERLKTILRMPVTD